MAWSPGNPSPGDLFGDRLAGVLGLEHDEVAGAAQDLPHQPGLAGVGELDDDSPIGQLLDHGPLLAQPARALGRDPDAGDVGGRHLAVGHPALDPGELLDFRARLEALLGEAGLLDAIELEVAYPFFGQVVAL